MAITTGSRTGAKTLRLRENRLLRWALEIDGAASALNGLAYLAVAKPLADLFGLPTALVLTVGAFLVLYGAALIVMSTRPRLDAAAVKAVVVMNAVWVVDSIIVAFAGWFDPTGVGVAWILVQAVVVGGFVAGQVVGLRRAS